MAWMTFPLQMSLSVVSKCIFHPDGEHLEQMNIQNYLFMLKSFKKKIIRCALPHLFFSLMHSSFTPCSLHHHLDNTMVGGKKITQADENTNTEAHWENNEKWNPYLPAKCLGTLLTNGRSGRPVLFPSDHFVYLTRAPASAAPSNFQRRAVLEASRHKPNYLQTG